MSMNHIYIDAATGAIGYQGDLAIDGDTYRDDLAVTGTLQWIQQRSDAPREPSAEPITGKVDDLRYAKLGRHEFEYLERIAPEARRQWLVANGHVRLVPTRVTSTLPSVDTNERITPMPDFDQTRTVHFGILNPAPNRQHDLPEGFISDGDSFLCWGEDDGDGTLHVLLHRYVFPSPVRTAFQRDAKEIITAARHRLNAALQPGERLFDYAVVTDSEDWSERVSTWTPTQGDTSVVGTRWDD